MPSGHTDGNFTCPREILCAQIKIETWIIQKVFQISGQHEHHYLTFSKSFPMIPSKWQFDQYEDGLSQIMCPLGAPLHTLCFFIKIIMRPGRMGAANVNPCKRQNNSHPEFTCMHFVEFICYFSISLFFSHHLYMENKMCA